MKQTTFGKSIIGRAMEILLIEDDLNDARAALQVLDRGHVRCRVSLVRDGEEAQDFIYHRGVFARAPRPDLILLDLQLPKKSGCELLAEFFADERLRTIPVVVMSAARSCQTLLDGGCCGVWEFMPKPLAAEQFVGMVKSLHYSLLTELVAGSMDGTIPSSRSRAVLTGVGG
jgi:two-component system, chemotaxis family, response regulator Rcp1